MTMDLIMRVNVRTTTTTWYEYRVPVVPSDFIGTTESSATIQPALLGAPLGTPAVRVGCLSASAGPRAPASRAQESVQEATRPKSFRKVS